MADVFDKDPNAVLDYTFDWSAWLVADTISTSTMTGSGVTIASNTNTTTTATAWVTGGTLGKQATITNRIVTAGGRTDERTITLNIVDR